MKKYTSEGYSEVYEVGYPVKFLFKGEEFDGIEISPKNEIWDTEFEGFDSKNDMKLASELEEKFFFTKGRIQKLKLNGKIDAQLLLENTDKKVVSCPKCGSRRLTFLEEGHWLCNDCSFEFGI